MLDRDIQDSRITAIERDGYPQEPVVAPFWSGEMTEIVEMSDEETVKALRKLQKTKGCEKNVSLHRHCGSNRI